MRLLAERMPSSIWVPVVRYIQDGKEENGKDNLNLFSKDCNAVILSQGKHKDLFHVSLETSCFLGLASPPHILAYNLFWQSTKSCCIHHHDCIIRVHAIAMHSTASSNLSYNLSNFHFVLHVSGTF